ncbi:MAG: hypothetical protein ABI168_09175 [Ginsengibacter sp.]
MSDKAASILGIVSSTFFHSVPERIFSIRLGYITLEKLCRLPTTAFKQKLCNNGRIVRPGISNSAHG